MISFFIFVIFRQKRNANAFFKFQPCPQSAEKYILSLIVQKISIFGLIADSDLQDLGALVTDPTPELKFLIRLQTVKNDITLLP